MIMQERTGSSTYLGSADEWMRQRNNAEHRRCSNKRRQKAQQDPLANEISGCATLRARGTEVTKSTTACVAVLVSYCCSWQSGSVAAFALVVLSKSHLALGSERPCTKPHPSQVRLCESFTDRDSLFPIAVLAHTKPPLAACF